MNYKTLQKKKTHHLLHSLATALHRFDIPILLILVILTGFFANFAVKLEHKTTVRDLLPEDNVVVRQFSETVNNFNMIDRLVVALQFEPEDLELAQAFADTLVDQVLADPDHEQYLIWFRAYLFNQSEETNWHDYLQYLTRILPPEKIPNLIERLQLEGIHNQIKQNSKDLRAGIAAKWLIEKDPLNLLELTSSYRDEITGNYRLDFSEGYLVSEDKRMLLIIGQPRDSPDNVVFSQELTEFLKRKIDQAEEVFQEEEDKDPKEVIQVGITGGHSITAHENQTIKGDVTSMFLSSFGLVLFLFVLAYRRPLAIFYVGVPLLCAEVWTLGIGYFLFGRLNLLTATFSAIIVGLGIDYAIHIFSRYLDERAKGLDPKTAMEISLSQTGMGTVVGGLTTALAFLAMGATDFAGMREFAVIAAVGIITCMFQMLFFLPSMIFIRERIRGSGDYVPPPQWDFHIEKLIRFCLNHRKGTLIVLTLVTLFLGFQAIGLKFNADIRSVRAKSNPSINLQSEVTQKVGGSLRSLTFVLEAENADDLYRMHDQMIPVLNKLKNEGSVARFNSILSLIQKPDAQRSNIEQIASSGLTGELLKKNYLEAMDAENFRVTEESKDYVDNLALSIDAREPITLANVTESHIPVVGSFLKKIDGKYKALIHVYPSKGLWEKKATRSLTADILNAVEPVPGTDIFVTGIQTLADELKSLVRKSFKSSTILAGLLVILVLGLHFRKMPLIILTLTPLLVSIIWMLGTMTLLGLDINLLNFVATPLIIGIGIDDGVHIVEKYLHRGSSDVCKIMARCGKAITLTSLTTIFGFSSLFMAKYSGFHSLGVCSILGVFFCWLGSVIVLPLLMETFKVKFIRYNKS